VSYRFVFMKPLGEELAQIAVLATRGVIRPIVDRIVPISESQSALEYLPRAEPGERSSSV